MNDSKEDEFDGGMYDMSAKGMEEEWPADGHGSNNRPSEATGPVLKSPRGMVCKRPPTSCSGGEGCFGYVWTISQD